MGGGWYYYLNIYININIHISFKHIVYSLVTGRILFYICWSIYLNKTVFFNVYLQTRFQKSWDTVQIVNKKGMQ